MLRNVSVVAAHLAIVIVWTMWSLDVINFVNVGTADYAFPSQECTTTPIPLILAVSSSSRLSFSRSTSSILASQYPFKKSETVTPSSVDLS